MARCKQSSETLHESGSRPIGRPPTPLQVWYAPNFGVNDGIEVCNAGNVNSGTIDCTKATFENGQPSGHLCATARAIDCGANCDAGTTCSGDLRKGTFPIDGVAQVVRRGKEAQPGPAGINHVAKRVGLPVRRYEAEIEQLRDRLKFEKESVKIFLWRVSKDLQDEEMQKRAAEKEGCQILIGWKRSGFTRTTLHWKLLQEVADVMRKGDTVVFWRLDRMGRIAWKMLKFISEMADASKYFKCLQLDSIDTTTAPGRMMIGQMCVFAQYESDNTSERVKSRLPIAWEKGHFGGGRRKLAGRALAEAKAEYAARPISPATGKRMTLAELANRFHVCVPTFVRYVVNGGMPRGEKNRAKFLASFENRPSAIGDVDTWMKTTDDPTWGLNPEKQPYQKRRNGVA